MVGVPGRSKGCQTCRRRRIRCATDPETLEYDELLPIQDAPALAPATVPAALPLTAFQDAIFITYTRSHLLRGVNDYSTLFQTLSPPSAHPLTSTSLIALSTTYFALSHPSAPSLRLRSHARYATALSAVNAALSAGPSPPIADALTAVVALALHEFLAPTAPAAWLPHCLGLARLFELRGARAVAAHPGLRALFETTRPVVIVAALAARRRCVFAREEWRRVPWEGAGGGGAPKDRVHLLMDLLVEGPGLLEERAWVERGAGGCEGRRRALLWRARELLRALEAWRREWEREYPSTRTEVPPVSEPPVGLDAAGAVRPLWATVWHYGCLYFGNVTALYCATHIFLLAFARSVSEPGACVEGDAGARALYDSATEICRSVDYHLLDCQNGAGSFFLLFPLRMAWQAFGSGASAEAKWVEQVLDNISRGSRGRWLVANHLAQPNLTNTGPS
ncbi:hypothetical protein GTA08_BOTSDO07668 [Neofusicoccum parvum]|uniref:Uncharacterized protein n=1 Tax=Neofusicoccum parvum TaxID=310453 RepID=A0ACB5S8G6_9PEZI|nr:hypothetical protein GTA08_BOTSDO07668 [Neofusicoccum parvum]